MAHEFDRLEILDQQYVLEPLANLLQHFLGLLWAPSFGSSCVLASGACPKTNAVERFTDVDDDAHDLIVALILQLLAYGSQQNVKPRLVIRLALLEGVCPASAVLVLGVLPLRTYSRFEEMVV